MVPDPIFSEPRLADVYDLVDSDRSDLGAYVALAEDLRARSVLDLGCGTGTLACLLAERGVQVAALDPAPASLDVARRKSCAERVWWLAGEATDLPSMKVDLVTMTGNVAQVFLSDEDWYATLRAAHGALRPNGSLVFEVRDSGRKAWREWDRDHTYRRIEVPGSDVFETWIDLLEVDLPLVSFRTTFVFQADGATLTSDSTLRFRDEDEIERSLTAAGFDLEAVRGAPDRPGLELVFVARRAGS